MHHPKLFLMKKNIFVSISLLLMLVGISCQKKDLPLDGSLVKERQAALEGGIKKMLQEAEYGFLFFPEQSSTISKLTPASNFKLEFDTIKNQVTMSSDIPGYSFPSTSYFSLSAATGLPLLIFSTESYISQIYAGGDQGITDFFFNILRQDGDTIKMQPYRKGNIFASEGGPVFNMVKRKPSINIPAGSATDTVHVILTKLADNSFELRNPIKFGAALNIGSYSAPVTAELKADPSLTTTYNQKHNTHYESFPEGTYELVKKETQIAAGSKNSVDSFEIHFKNLEAFQKDKAYILPVKASAASPFVTGFRSVAYIVLNTNNVDPKNSIMAGALMSRVAWEITASNNYSPIANVLDGDNNTVWSTSRVTPQWVQLDMGASKTVKGFVLTPSYLYINENWLTVKVSSSSDGVNWKFEGVYFGSKTSPSSSVTNPDIKYMNFLTPINARYFKFDVLKASSSFTGLSELNAIE